MNSFILSVTFKESGKRARNMWYIIFTVYFMFVLGQLDAVQLDNSYIRIPLIRQRTPRENAYVSSNMEQHGIYLDWLRKPHTPKPTNDSIALFRYFDTEFYGEVQIGQKGQKFNMVFDTAWQLSWVISQDCSWKTVGCWFHNKYDHTVSSTYKPIGTKYIVNEGSYNLTGYYSNDTFSISHSRANGTAFVEMTSIPYTYIFNKADGVMGLGLRTGTYVPFFYKLLQTGQIKNPLFSVYLNRDRQSRRGGNVLLGFIDKKHIHHLPGPGNTSIPETITYLPVDSTNGFWGFKIDRIQLDITSKKKTYVFCTKSCKGIADTSNSLILGPKSEIQSIHNLMNAKYAAFGRYRVSCDTVNKLPPIDFILSGKNFTLKSEQYTQKMSLGPVTVCVSAFVSSSVPFEQENWIIGGAFLSHFYSIYDIQNSQIGFVRAA